MKVVAIIPAAGLGTRMASAPESKGKKPVASKQFTELGGTPILIHTLRKFAASPEVSEIYVALRKNEISGFQTRLEQDERNILPKKTHIVEGAADGFIGTDEASLVERSGHDVAVVMGSPRNIKITTPGDLELAEFYLGN